MKFSCLLVTAAAALVSTSLTASSNELKSRVLLVPGLASSRLSASIKTDGAAWCRTHGNHFALVWISLRRIFCSHYLKLVFNPITKTYTNRPGVTVKVPGFGKTNTVECVGSFILCTLLRSLNLMDQMVKFFVRQGYQRGADIRAAPYDWRLAPDSLRAQGYYAKLKGLIETMYNGKKVTIATHSLGSLTTLYFLNSVVTSEWKNKYVKAFVPMGAPWGGAVQTLSGFLYGYIPASNQRIIPRFIMNYSRCIIRTLQSAYFLAPRPDVFGSQVLVRTPTKNYTAQNYQQLYQDIHYPIGWQKHQAALGVIKGYPNPGVPTFCIYGTNVPTPEQLVYNKSGDLLNAIPKIIHGNGDGSVNKESLEICHRWAKKVTVINKVNHSDIVRSSQVMHEILRIATADTIQ
uniref:Group XV phospholipase A2-like protein n=1 Tax=Halisarca dujardinii TaxID=2583056 RepID=A0AA96MN55_HALDU|nr:group XV phospholipase A2-like protein [Halisarca dujardinii]